MSLKVSTSGLNTCLGDDASRGVHWEWVGRPMGPLVQESATSVFCPDLGRPSTRDSRGIWGPGFRTRDIRCMLTGPGRVYEPCGGRGGTTTPDGLVRRGVPETTTSQGQGHGVRVSSIGKGR